MQYVVVAARHCSPEVFARYVAAALLGGCMLGTNAMRIHSVKCTKAYALVHALVNDVIKSHDAVRATDSTLRIVDKLLTSLVTDPPADVSIAALMAWLVRTLERTTVPGNIDDYPGVMAAVIWARALFTHPATPIDCGVPWRGVSPSPLDLCAVLRVSDELRERVRR